MNVGKSKVIRCLRYGGRMHVRLNSEPFKEVVCFKYQGRKWQQMEVVKWMWKQPMRGIESGEC